MKSKFWEKKMRSYFRRLDFNNDGILSREDFVIFGTNFSELEHEGSERKPTIVQRTVELFEALTMLIASGEDVTEDKFVEGLHKQIYAKELLKAIEQILYAVFVAVDSDGDGYIQEEEYIKFLGCIVFDDYENVAKAAFRGIDTDHDGILNFDEWRSAVLDFWYGDNENGHGTLFFGPLI